MHGYCHTLVSDNGQPYNSQDFKIYCKRRGIRNRPVNGLHPRGNVMAKRMVKMIHMAILDDKVPRREVYMLMMTHNHTPHSVTDTTPAEILMKRFQRTNLPSLPAKPYSEDKMVRERDKASKEKNKRDFDKRKKPKTRRLRLGTR